MTPQASRSLRGRLKSRPSRLSPRARSKPMTGTRSGYSTTARLLHWIVAILVLLMIAAGVVMTREGIGRSLQDTLRRAEPRRPLRAALPHADCGLCPGSGRGFSDRVARPDESADACSALGRVGTSSQIRSLFREHRAVGACSSACRRCPLSRRYPPRRRFFAHVATGACAQRSVSSCNCRKQR